MSQSITQQAQALSITYRSRSATTKRERRVLCVMYGTPPITSAEVEIMKDYLAGGFDAANDVGDRPVERDGVAT